MSQERFWNSWQIRNGYLRFNELTGELMISRGLEMPPSRPKQLPEPPPLAKWEELREPVSFSSVPGGDWRTLPHLASKAAWKSAMQPRCEEFEPLGKYQALRMVQCEINLMDVYQHHSRCMHHHIVIYLISGLKDSDRQLRSKMGCVQVIPWCKTAGNRQPLSAPRLRIKRLGGLQQPISHACRAFPTARTSCEHA